jgi:predicted  nucleic acid-binding Zn-ribbon protein
MSMKAEVAQQQSLLELAELDASLSRLEHRAKNLVEQQRLEEVQAAHREANDRLAALQIAIDDLDAQIAKFESEIDAVRQREERDRKLLTDGTVDAKQLTELQHELDTLERRQAALEDSQLEVMERREELQGDQQSALERIDELQKDLGDAQTAFDGARTDLDQQRHRGLSRRDELVASLDPDLVKLYERQRARGGAGAGQLQGRRCGACRIEIDKGELARISGAADDDVLRCPECGAILLRVRGTGG